MRSGIRLPTSNGANAILSYVQFGKVLDGGEVFRDLRESVVVEFNVSEALAVGHFRRKGSVVQMVVREVGRVQRRHVSDSASPVVVDCTIFILRTQTPLALLVTFFQRV